MRPGDPGKAGAASATVLAALVLKLVEKGALTPEDAREVYGVSEPGLQPKTRTHGSDIEAEIAAVIAQMGEAPGSDP